MAIRHPKEGAPMVASRNAYVPIINAGDGGHNHPTQTLADLCTIKNEKGRLTDLTVGFCGDLKFGRTVHSLLAALSRYTGIKVVLISPKELRIPSYVKHETIGKSGMEYVEVESLEEAMPSLDVLYMTRIQKERFSYVEDYERLKDSYILTPEKLETAKDDLVIMHPLPRVNEISVAVDKDPRAKYFLQTLYGKYMRMALILFLLDEKQKNTMPKESKYRLVYDKVCKNPACICSTEQEIEQVFKCVNEEEQVYRCIWCDSRAK